MHMRVLIIPNSPKYDLPISRVDLQLFPVCENLFSGWVGGTAAAARLAGSSLVETAFILQALVMKNDVLAAFGTGQWPEAAQGRRHIKPNLRYFTLGITLNQSNSKINSTNL